MTPMSMGEFFLLYALLMISMALCRCVPLFALRGRELSPRVIQVLDLIPVAAFAALVANDLFQPAAWDAGALWPVWVPLLAALGVICVARWTRSLIWCAVAGLVLYVALMALPL